MAGINMEIRYSEKAVKQIRRIHKGDRKIAELKAIEQERADYNSAIAVKTNNKAWTSHAQLKKQLGL